jgi:hypothetical protein
LMRSAKADKLAGRSCLPPVAARLLFFTFVRCISPAVQHCMLTSLVITMDSAQSPAARRSMCARHLMHKQPTTRPFGCPARKAGTDLHGGSVFSRRPVSLRPDRYRSCGCNVLNVELNRDSSCFVTPGSASTLISLSQEIRQWRHIAISSLNMDEM